MPLDTGTLVLAGVGATVTVAGSVGGYALRDRLRPAPEPNRLDALRDALVSRDCVALLLPDAPTVDAVAAAVGLGALATAWGVSTRVVTYGEITTEDARAFCTLFDVSVANTVPPEADAAVAVGGAGPVPSPAGPPVVASVRHHPAPNDGQLVLTGDDGATATTVTHLVEEAAITPDARTASALLYGIRAGTQEFRRVRGPSDYDAARFLHEYADQGRLDALRAPGLGDETFDVLGTAIKNRERRATFAVANAGSVPAVSALEDATDTLLRLDGVTSAATFGVHDDTVVASCRSDDVRQSASDVLEAAFQTDAVAGTADTATARIELGLFARVSQENRDTLDELVDASARKALFAAVDTA